MTDVAAMPSSQGHGVGDAAAGARAIEASRVRMPALAMLAAELGGKAPLGGARIAACMPLTAPVAVLVELLAGLGAQLCWAAGEGQPTDADVAAAVAAGGSATIAPADGGERSSGWEAIHHAFDPDRGGPADLVIDGGGAATLLLHLGVAAEGGELERFAHPEAGEDRALIEAVRRVLAERPGFYGAAAIHVGGASVETGTAGHWLASLQAHEALLFPVLTVDDTVMRIRRRVLIDGGWTEHFLNAPAQASLMTSASLAAHAVALVELFAGRGAPARVHALPNRLGDWVARLHETPTAERS